MNQRAVIDVFQSDVRHATVAVLLLAALVFMVFPLFKLPCFFEALTSVPCPLCGGTQAIVLLCSGNPLAALQSNPAVTALAVVFVLALVAEGVTRHLKLASVRHGYLAVRAHVPVTATVVTGVSWFWLVLTHIAN